jgi:hypothetical protein
MTEEGIRGFLVERGTPGFATPEIERKLSLRTSVTAALFFDNVVVPEENVLPQALGTQRSAVRSRPGPLRHRLGGHRGGASAIGSVPPLPADRYLLARRIPNPPHQQIGKLLRQARRCYDIPNATTCQSSIRYVVATARV